MSESELGCTTRGMYIISNIELLHSRSSKNRAKLLNIITVIVIAVVPKMVKVNLDIEDGLHKTIRKEAIDRGITMKAYLIELIEAAVRAQEDKGVEEGEGIEE